MEYKNLDGIYAVKVAKGEKILDELQKFVEKENIMFAKIEGIGAINNVELGLLEDGVYYKKKFEDFHELLSLQGSVAGDFKIHLHASMADKEFNVRGGHLFNATVAGIAEIFVTVVSKEKMEKVKRGNDPLPTWLLEK